MKRATRVTLISFSALLLVAALLIGSLFTHPVQRFIAHRAAHILTTQTGYNVSIADVQYHPFSTITLTDAAFSHPSSDSILTLPHLQLSIKWAPLLHHRLHITSIVIDSLSLHIHIFSDGTTNIDFLRNIRTNPNSRLTLQIDNITLADCSLSVDNDLPQRSAPRGSFNPHHISIPHLTTSVSLTNYARNNIAGAINSLTLTESSGLTITSLQTQIAITDTTLTMPRFHLTTPSSRLYLDTLTLTYDSLRSFLHLQSDATVQALISPSSITLADFSPFLPSLHRYRKPLSLQGNFVGTLDTLHCTNLNISYADAASFSGHLSASHLRTPDSISYRADIHSLHTNTIGLQDIIATAKGAPYQLPKQVKALGSIHYVGSIQGNLHAATLDGRLTTDVGTIRTDCKVDILNRFQDFLIDGRISATRLHLHRILPNSQLSDASFTITTTTQVGKNTPLSGAVHANVQEVTYRSYTYKDIYFKGDYTSRNFLGEIIFNDDNGTLDATGAFNWDRQEPQYAFTATLDNFRPYNMHLTSRYPNLAIGLSLNTDIAGSTIDNLQGQFTLSNLSLQSLDTLYTLDSLQLLATHSDTLQSLTITSPLLSASLSGQYKFSTLRSDLLSTLHTYLPSIHSNASPAPITNDFTYSLSLHSIDSLTRIFSIPWEFSDTITLGGHYTPTDLSLALSLPYLHKKNGKSSFHNLTLAANDSNSHLNLLSTIDIHAPKFATTLSAHLSALNDTLVTLIDWYSDTEKLFEGEFLSLTEFSKQDRLLTHTNILPTQFYLRDSLWNISPAHIYSDFATVQVDSFSLYRPGQLISINGLASKEMTDTITVQLQDIDLDYVSTFIPAGTVAFGGKATGNGFVTNTFTKPIFIAEAHVPQFALNYIPLGEATASTGWDVDKKALIINGVVTNDTTPVAQINGHYFFSNDSLDLIGHANHLDLRFLDFWLTPITLSAQGFASGETHIYGKRKEVTVTAEALASPAELGVDYLKTSYTFNDSIILTPDSMLFRNIAISDKQGHTGHIDGYVSHKYFKDFRYNINIHADNMKVMDTNEKDNSYFYGQVYATGDVNIYGNDKIGTNISASAISEPHTRVIIPISYSSTAKDNSFVNFVSNRNEVDDKDIAVAEEQGFNMKVNLKLDVQPSAETILYIDPTTDDILKAYGNGNLIITYDGLTDEMQLFGDYTLASGNYTFTLQNALRKDFRIHNGSTIRWVDGVPYNAEVDINASYQLTASLSDILDKSVLAYTSRTSVPVQCLLHLTGSLTQPNIQFGLNLPNSDEELNRALLSVVNTEELMNREIVYLLAMGKFYTPEYMQMSAQGELLALASSTLSSQLNNWASQLFDNWDFGVNFRSSGEGADKSNEYEFTFLYAPNDRLTINGNVGYLDDNLSASKFIGDVDAEYKLTPNGKLSMKAYNHTNDYKEFKTALTTQGVGFVWRESFSSGKALREEWKISIARQKAEREKKRAERKEKREKKKAEKEKNK